MQRRTFLSATALAAVSCTAPAIARIGPAIDPDVRLLGEVLTALHPGLQRYLSPAQFAAGLDRLDHEWRAEPEQESRYLSLSRFLATIRCGHSYANFFNQKRQVRAALFDRPSRLPFAFRWIGGDMVVLADHSGTSALPRGAVVKSVNGIPARAILARLLPYARADGHNDAKRRALLAVAGADEIEFFDVFQGLVCGMPVGGTHRLQVRLPGTGRTSTLDLPALSLTQRQGFIRQTGYDGDQPVWDWAIGSDGIARLTMDGWALYNSKWDWQTWLNERLDSLSGAKGLIVDLRENEGGNDCGDAILARLTAKDIVPPRANQLVRYRKIPPALNPHLDTWDDSFRDWDAAAVPFNDRFLRLTRWEESNVIASKGPRVTVPMAVLTSAQNSSATFQFASLVKATGLGTLIGGPTGGNRRGINGGAFFFVRLPESEIEFDLPLIGYYPETPQPDAGITPDILVQNSAADIAAGRDRELETARRWLLSR